MILEGIVTTLDPTDIPHITPMGPQVDPEMRSFVLRPFNTSQTYRNLKQHGEGVLHVTDDVLLLAQAAVGQLATIPNLQPARRIRGQVLNDACRAYEFRVESIDETEERIRIEATVVEVHRLRDFFGFNRAKHAVVEAAILATRIHMLPIDEIEAEFRRLAIPIAKTAGPQELLAFDFLQRYLAEEKERR